MVICVVRTSLTEKRKLAKGVETKWNEVSKLNAKSLYRPELTERDYKSRHA